MEVVESCWWRGKRCFARWTFLKATLTLILSYFFLISINIENGCMVRRNTGL